MEKHFAAIDLGATSGRVILGTLSDEGALVTKEIHRFPNKMIRLGEGLHWDIYSLFENIKHGLSLIAKSGIVPNSIGVDTWGVDFGCVAPDGSIIGLPMAYRDKRTIGAAHRHFTNILSANELYTKTGIQHIDFNTIFQFNELRGGFALEHAETLLFMPDLIAYLLTGEKVTEYTIASTGAIVDPDSTQLSEELLASVGLTKEKFGKFVNPGTVIGTLSKSVSEETGLPQIPVVAVGGHDTASAVAAIPATDGDFAYLSSGTWSLMGIEVSAPVISEETLRENITNEGGVEKTIRLLKNITGMWIVEQCLNQWKSEGTIYTYSRMVELAEDADTVCIIDPDDTSFTAPNNMVEAIDEYCRETNQPIPSTHGEYLRSIFDSLALKYAKTLDVFRRLSEHPINRLHIIGGGSRNAFLNQLTADACRIPVVAGPAEATALGNIMLQAIATGTVKDLAEMRKIIADNIETEIFLPQIK